MHSCHNGKANSLRHLVVANHSEFIHAVLTIELKYHAKNLQSSIVDAEFYVTLFSSVLFIFQVLHSQRLSATPASPWVI